jgi:hypothetical protein
MRTIDEGFENFGNDHVAVFANPTSLEGLASEFLVTVAVVLLGVAAWLRW